jgi:outer membrane protein
MKSILLKILFIFLIIPVTSLFAEDIKMAWVDSDMVLEGFKGREELKANFQKKVKALEDSARVLQQELIALREEYQKGVATWSEKTKKEKEEYIRGKLKTYQDYVEKNFGKDGVVENEMQELTKPVLKQIYKIITDLSIKYKYKMIFDKRGTPQILFAKPEFDITKEVVEELNKASGEPPKEEKKEEKKDSK